MGKKWCILSALSIATFAQASVPIVFNQPPEPPKQFDESTYRLGWDIDMSPYAGGEDILFVQRCLERAEGYMISKTPIYYSKAAQARFWRLTELFLGWMPVNFLALVAQHEVFGHGYRIRDIDHGSRVTGYQFDTPPPYGSGGGSTRYEIGPTYNTTDETAVAMAGVESTSIIALLTKFKWLESGKIDPRQTVLYLLGQYDLPLYIGTLKALKELSDDEQEEQMHGHDMVAYVRSLNQTYPKSLLSVGRLRSITWINLADPFTYYAIYAWFHYISAGKESSIPMIPIGSYRYLPGLRFALTPFGPEYYIENFLVCKNRPFYFYVKIGRHAQNNYFGMGYYVPKFWSFGNWSIGSRLDAWRQPKLLLGQGQIPYEDINFSQKPDPNNPLYSYAEQHEMRIGAGFSMIVDYKLSSKSGFEAELGYKAQGFVPGESLFAAPIARVYYTLVF